MHYSRHVAFILVFASFNVAFAQTTAPSTRPVRPDPHQPIDLSKNKTLYVVGYAHLDTQWRWAYPLVIREYIPNTMRHNFAFFEKYPNYIFNFSGSRRYEMMKEYYPKDYEKLKEYVAKGRWFVCGSSVDENDAIVPSSESQIRQVLYGNRFARMEFGKESAEYMLPDCFGFPASLPTILAHCGINGFSTQKLTWGSAVGVPFKVGVWEGVDGSSVIAALDPGSYAASVKEDLSLSESWLKRIDNTGEKSGAYVDYHYYGTGDRGGAPEDSAIDWVEKSVAGAGPLNIVSSNAEKMFLDITSDQRAKLPRYKGELLLTQHSAGAINSQAYMKRWNRKNELLADAAERASVAASWLGGMTYPSKTLYDAWVLVLGSQMHDMLPGTSLPKCYEYCWNDELLALNQFASVTQTAVGAIASQMDTQSQGVPLVVYNPLSIEREDVVEATVNVSGPIGVSGPDGKEVPWQSLGQRRIAFLAKVPSVGFAVFDVRLADDKSKSELKVTDRSLENARFRVTLSDAGDIASIFDKQNNREALSAPARLAFLYENPSQFPAWNMDWNDRKNPPRSYVTGPAKFRMVEMGPVRVTLEVTRESEGSRFVQRISLSSGAAADRVNVSNTIDWQTRERSLKATFPLAVSNSRATYQISVGALERGNNDPKKYEVPQHHWFDLTSADGKYGVAVLNDSKYGSDKPTDNELRLTLIYTPGTRGGYRDQGTQDIGRHQIDYAIAPHAGDWRDGKVQWNAARFNQPLMAFQSPAHPGALGKTFSLLKVSSDQACVDAIKKAEDSDEIVVRLKELSGKPVENVRITSASPIASAREVNGQEKEIAAAKLVDGAIVTEMKPYQLRAFAIKLNPAAAKVSPPPMQSIALPFNVDAMSTDDNRVDGAFDSGGRTYPAEQMPAKIISEGIEFSTGSKADGQNNAVICKGQTIQLPGGFNRVYLLASAIDGDQTATFKIGERSITQQIQEWGGYIGQWDNRLWSKQTPETATEVEGEWSGLAPGYVKRDTVAWFCSHRHHPQDGNEFYQYSYLFKYGFDIPSGATSITLPDNDKVRVFAITVASGTTDATIAAHPLYDTLKQQEPEWNVATVTPPGGSFNDMTTVTLNHPLYWTAGGLRYTIDGTEPTMESPQYVQPIQLSSSAQVRVKQFDESGQTNQEHVSFFEVNDTTPPQVKSVTAVAMLPNMRIDFSEPVRKADAEKPQNYTVSPTNEVKSATLSEDGTSVALTLAKPP
ncbi:MAG: chitobiase/beta-hexosaminidase C-terminal domain-containing protein, partial [Anaerolineae bacterium]|nr:chitobiase/beta-hexosaminidase C-terminal domain-containing protein [Phycisphaerae bacterium]